MSKKYVKKFLLGEELKKLRLDQNKKPEDVWEGICNSRDEYWRYENGDRRPNWNTFAALLGRLDADPRRYFSLYAEPNDDKNKDKLIHLLKTNNPENYDEISTLIGLLEANEEFMKHKLNHQALLSSKATFALRQERYDDMYKYAFEGINISRPGFNKDKISSYSLFSEEAILINRMAIACFYAHSKEEGVEILKQLKGSFDARIGDNYFSDDDNAKFYIRVIYDLSKGLGLFKNLEEALLVCNEGISICKKSEQWFFFPLLVINKGCALFEMGKKEEGMACFKQAHSFLEASERFAELAKLSLNLERSYGIVMPLN